MRRVAENGGTVVPAPETHPRIHIRVKRHDDGRVEINWNDVPVQADVQLVRNALPPEYRSIIAHRYWLNCSLSGLIQRFSVIPAQVWADAIGQAVVLMMSPAHQAGAFDYDAEGPAALQTLLSGAGHLALGNYLYKLQPVAAVPTNRAMATLRAKMRAQVGVERERLLTGAQREAQIIVEQADVIRRQVEASRVELRSLGRLSVPVWATYRMTLRGDYEYPFVLELPEIRFQIDTFRYENGETQEVLEWDLESPYSVYVTLFLPVNFGSGEYYVGREGNTCRIQKQDGGAIKLPHITFAGTCLQPVGVPTTLHSKNDVTLLIDGLVRAHRVVNLNSLLSPPESWPSELFHRCPQHIRNGTWHNAEAAETATRRISLEAESQNTWTL